MMTYVLAASVGVNFALLLGLAASIEGTRVTWGEVFRVCIGAALAAMGLTWLGLAS